jgi:PAS domain S-box-containing protein
MGKMEKRQEVLADFGEFALRSDDLDAVLTQACRLVAEALGTTRAKVLEVEHGSRTLFVRAGVGWPEGVIGRLRLPMDEPSSETYSIAAGRPVITNDLAQETRFDFPAFLKQAGVRALANVPIFLPGGRPFGLLQVDATEPRAFTDDDSQFLRTYATILGPVIDRLLKVQALGRSEERFRAVVEATHDYAIVLTDPQDRITDWLGGAEAVFGWTAGEVVGQPGAILFTPEDREAGVPEAEVRAARDMGSAPDVRWHLRKDGSTVFIEGATTALRDEAGRLKGYQKIGQDVTGRKRAEAALRESEQRFRGLVEGMAQAVWEADAEGRAVSDSPSWRAYTGQTLDAWLGHGWLDAIHPDDRAHAERQWREAVAARRNLDAEFRIRHASGGWRWTNVRAVPLSGPDGAIRRWAGMNIDITDRKGAEDALRESEARLGRALDVGELGAWELDLATMAAWRSPQHDRIFGYEAMLPEWTYDRFLDHVVPDDRGWVDARFREAIAGGGRWDFECRIERADGERRWIWAQGKVDAGPDGRPEPMKGMVRDVTARKRIEETLAASEERLRTLMEGIPQLVWRSCGEGRWTWSSPQWQAFTGQSQDESQGLGWLGALHPDDREDTLRAWEAARPHGMLDVEYRVRRAADGAYLWHQTRSVPVRDGAGRVVEWLGTTTDVQQLRELQDRQGVMVAELQHRTRNLIAVVHSIAQQTMAATGPTEAFRDEFHHRLEALSRVQGLLSRSEEEPITIRGLIDMELDALGALNGARERVVLDGPEVRLRHSLVQTLALGLHELATNARKHGALSHDEGLLSVTWRVVDADGEGRRLALEWTETGGAAPVDADRPHRGYGRELIERALPYALGARTEYELGPEGVRCAIDLPLDKTRRRRAP